MKTKNSNEIKSKNKPSQFLLFELLDSQDLNYSNFVDFFDSIPKFVDFGRKRYWDYSTVKPTISTEFTYLHSSNDEKATVKTFIVTLKPGRIKNKKGLDVLVYPSIQKEEAIYDALRKLSCSGYGAFFGDDLGTAFTLNMLQKELKKFNKTYSIDEIKESLQVLRSAEIHVKAIDGSFEWEPSYLSNMALSTREDFLASGSNTKCLVLFDNLVSSSVKKLDFREYNYAIAQSSKNAIAKYLTKRLDRKFTQASPNHIYGPIKMSTIFKAVFREMDKKMSNNTRLMNSAIEEMKKHDRISHVDIQPIKNAYDGRIIDDYAYCFYPHSKMISDMKRFHAKKKIVNNKMRLENSQ